MKKIFILLVFSCFLYGADNNNGNNTANKVPQNPNETLDEREKKIFKSMTDKIVTGDTCTWECRDVNSGYKIQITGIDFRAGKTFCKVYKEGDMDRDLGIDASKTNKACRPKSDLVQVDLQTLNIQGGKVNTQSRINYEQNEQQITMTKFLTSLLTLNPTIIDREQTNHLGEITLKNGIEPFSITNMSRQRVEWMKKDGNTYEQITSIFEFNRLKNNFSAVINSVADSALSETNNPATTSAVNYDKTNALDGFNKNNMAYFSDLFLANEKIYQHLQIFIFILIGGFFVTQIGANKLQAYLENRGDSEAKQPYLHKFYIPIVMIATFFMPIPEANGLAHSTIMQNVIRYFTIHSTNLADMANAVGAKTYMNKIYKSLGGLDEMGVASILADKAFNQFTLTEANKIYKNTCALRYGDELARYNYSNVKGIVVTDRKNLEAKDRIGHSDPNGLSGTKKDISFDACMLLEVQIRESRRQISRLDSKIKGMENFSKEYSSKIDNIDNYFAIRDKQLGWADVILIPSSAILAETFVFNDSQMVEYDIEESTASNARNTRVAIANGDANAPNDDISDSWLGWIAGKLVWMLMPGAGGIKDFLLSNFEKIGAVILGAIGAVAPIPGGSIGGGVLGAILAKVGGTIGAYILTVTLLEWTFDKVPLLVCTTASVVAFVSYLVSLCKYFYISPFVVAFGMATKRMDKIIEFLISGIAIFLKPVLIVLFVYLALFLNTLIEELFIFMSIEQFTGIDTSAFNFYTNFMTGAITGLLLIFGKLAASYITWKLIVSAPGWALSLVGIDGKQDDMIASGLEQNLARRAFIA